MATLRAGAGRAVITPELGSHIAGYFEDRLAQDVHDDLHANALVLESGDTSLAIVVCDLVDLVLDDTERAKAAAQERTGIPAENIFIACTHTHFGPTTSHGVNVAEGIDYMDWLPGRIADSVKMAQNRIRPAQLAHASGHCAEEGHNRRYVMKDGTIVTNPGILNPEVVKPADGQSHVDTSITADYFGAFGRALPRMAGADFAAIMMNGCAGDINNIDVLRPAPEYPDPWYQINRVADVLAAAAFKAWRGIRLSEFQRDVKLGAATDVFTFRRREFTPEHVEAAKKRLKGGSPKNLGDREWLEANTTIRLSERPLERKSCIQAMRIGDLGLVGLPGEIFVEIGMEIKQRSPFKRMLIGELANDWLGYIPTPKAFEEGSYEVYTTAASPATAPAMIDSALKLLGQLAD